MFHTEPEHSLPADESPWIRRCCSNASVVGVPTERPAPDNEMQVLLCCQHNGRMQFSSANPKQICSPPPQTAKSAYVVVLEQFVRFCKNTSLRGVPRIVKAKDRKLRLLWTVFFLIFLIGCISCVSMMVLQYLDHATMEKPSSRPHHPLNFPSITVCNTRPFSVRGINLLNANRIMTPVIYRNVLFGKLREAVYRYKFSNVQKRYLSNAFLVSMFMQTLPSHIRPAMLGHRLDELILGCNLMLTEGSIPVYKPCHEVGTWTTTFSELFLNCYTLTISNHSSSVKAMKVNMTIYLGKRFSRCLDCHSSYETQLDGVRLQIHEANTYPSVNEGGMYLSPGKLTEVEFTTRVIHMKEPPYGACKEDQPKNISLDRHLFTFSRSACFISELQRKIIGNCHCFSAEKPLPIEFADTKYRPCRKVILNPSLDAPKQQAGMDKDGRYYKQYLEDFMEKIRCKIKTESEYALEHRGCPKRCVFNEFETTISSTRWPTRAYQDRFMDSVAAMKEDALRTLCAPLANGTAECVAQARLARNLTVTDVADLYDAILRWRQPRADNKSETERVIERMLRDEFFSDHLISLIVRRPHFGIKLVEEKEVITLTSLLSQVGGLLSIFIGLNFAILVEIIELFYNIFQSLRDKRR